MTITSDDIGESKIHGVEELIEQFPHYNWERENDVWHVTYVPEGKHVFDVEVTEKRGVLDKVNPKYLGPPEDFNLHKWRMHCRPR